MKRFIFTMMLITNHVMNANLSTAHTGQEFEQLPQWNGKTLRRTQKQPQRPPQDMATHSNTLTGYLKFPFPPGTIINCNSLPTETAVAKTSF